MPDIGFLNGRFMPLNEVAISIEDRGFQFGDGVYEVIRTYKGRPFQLDAHLMRLERSAKAIDLQVPFIRQQWEDLVQEGIRLAAYSESKVYIQLTRGVAPRDHLFPLGVQPTVVMTIREMKPLDPVLYTNGVAVITTEDVRWGRCDIKSLNLLPNVLARQRAKEAGAFEAIFVHRGCITEGSVSNVIAVRDGMLITSPESVRILSGITRTVVLELAHKEGIPVQERDIAFEEFRAADEIFLTGTTVEILPVVRVDQVDIGTGRPGAITKRLTVCFNTALR